MYSNNKKIDFLQKIELFIGIDIAKSTHYASIIDQTGRELKSGIKVTNDVNGFKNLIKEIGDIDKKKVLIAVEPTGQYWKCTENFLSNEGLNVCLINPFHVNRSKEIRDNKKTKNDKKDSKLIAHLAREGKYLNTLIPEGPYANLREYSRSREQIKVNLARNFIQLRALLDEFLPEFQDCFYNIRAKSSIGLLKNFGISMLRQTKNKPEKINCLELISRKQIRDQKAEQIINKLHSSIGLTKGLLAAEDRLKLLLDSIEFNQNQLDSINKKLIETLEQTEEEKYILTIPGVGQITAAVFLGQTGALRKFGNAKQIEKLAGMDLTENTSGKYKGKKHMSKRGRDLLRQTLYLMAIAAIGSNNELKEIYLKRINVDKKPKMIAVIHIMLKILKIIFAVAKNKNQYDATKVCLSKN